MHSPPDLRPVVGGGTAAIMPRSIRAAGPEDAETLHRFICALAEYEKEPDAVEVSPEQLAAQLRQPSPPFECLLAEEGGQPVGFALFFQSYSTWKGKPGLWLEDLFVPEQFRGHGHGQALLSALARIAVERDYGRMEWSVLDWNEPAIGFYRQLGAASMDEWTTNRLQGESLRRLGEG